MLKTKSGGVRSTHSPALLLAGEVVVGGVDLDDGELGGVEAQGGLGVVGALGVPAGLEQGRVGPGGGPDPDRAQARPPSGCLAMRGSIAGATVGRSGVRVCSRCQTPVQAGGKVCERCEQPVEGLAHALRYNPAGLPTPSPIQGHATVLVAIVAAVVLLAFGAWFVFRGVGLFRLRWSASR